MPTLNFISAHAVSRGRSSAIDPVAVAQLNDSLWRITRPEGDVLGYIESFAAPGGQRFRAKRFLARQRRFMIDGEFWAMDDALECFRSLAA